MSGNEPTIGRDHLQGLLELIDRTRYRFILETNGILIGADADYATQLARFRSVHVRVSLKGTNPEEFARLTGAAPEGFNLQLKALGNLLNAGVSCHPAVMLSFSPRGGFRKLVDRLREVDARLAGEVEEEYVFLYPHVVERLNRAGVQPLTAYSPNEIPEELI